MSKNMRTGILCFFVLLSLGILGMMDRHAQPAVAAANLAWSSAAPLIDPEVGIMVKCVDDPNHFYLVGGVYGMLNLSDGFYRYTIGNPGEWEQLLTLPDKLEGVFAACYKGKIYAAGGSSDGFVVTRALYIYDTLAITPTWNIGADLPDVVSYGGMAAWDGKLYVIGGIRSHQNLVPVNRVDVYDIDQDTWTAGGGADLPYAASHFGGAQVGLYFYAVGGIGIPYPSHLNTTQRYNLATNKWELGPEFISKRALHSLTTTSTHLYAIGGDQEGGGDFDFVSLVETLDLATWPDGAWADLNEPIPQPLGLTASTCTEVLTGGEIWSAGGIRPDQITVDINLYLPSEPCASFGADLPDPMTGEGRRGKNVEYQLTLTNLGNVTDYYSLDITSDWPYFAPVDNLGPIKAGESLEFTITVEVPPDVGVGDQGITQVTATSISNPTAGDSTSLTTTAITWTAKAPLIDPLVSTAVQCAEDPDYIYLVNGAWGDLINSNALYRYTISLDEWDRLEDVPAALQLPLTTCYQGKIYVAGGANSSLEPVKSFYIYDTLAMTSTWVVGPELPDVVDSGGLAAWDGKLYVIGGVRSHSPYTPLSRVDVFDIASQQWTVGGGADIPYVDAFFGYAQAGPYYYIVGGVVNNVFTYTSKTARYNLATDEWALGPELPIAKSYAYLAITGTNLYSLGGELYNGSQLVPVDTVETLDLSAWPAGSWETLIDSLPQPTLGATSACTEQLTGGEIWAIGGATYPWQMFDTNYYLPTEPCVSYAVDLPEPMAGMGLPAASVEYQLMLTNTGIVTDYYTLMVDSDWSFNAPIENLGPVAPGESLQFTVTVDVPADAMSGDQGLTGITAYSVSNPIASDTTSITTTALGQYLMDLQLISPTEQDGHPGQVLTYTLQVNNLGNIEDSYTVEISAAWETSGPASIGPIPAYGSAELVINVKIPAEAMEKDWDQAVITVSSQSDPLVTTQVTLTSKAVFHRLLMPLAMKN